MESYHDDINGSPTESDMLERMTQNHAEAALAVLNDNRPRGALVVPVDEVENLTPMMIAFFGLVQTMLGAYTLPQLKVLGRRLRKMGFRSVRISGKKAEIVASIRKTIHGQNATFGFTDATHPPMPLEVLRVHGHYGTLGETVGARVIITDADGNRRIHFNQEIIQQDGLTPSAIDSRNWVNTGYDAVHMVESGSIRTKRGVMKVGDRFTCDKNADFYAGLSKLPGCTTRTGIPSFVKGDGTERGRGGHIESGVCPTCHGPAKTLEQRHGVSTLNAQFAHAIVIRPDGTIPTSRWIVPKTGQADALRPQRIRVKDTTRHGPRRVTAQIESEGGRAWEWEQVEVTEWIGPRISPIHLQKRGGRYAQKIDGRTVWLSGSFVRGEYPIETGGTVLVWFFVCNANPSDRTRHADYNPAQPSRAVQAVLEVAKTQPVKNNNSANENLSEYLTGLNAARIGGGGL
tara:strand:- start:1046 stop:2422 length:1377 start_codon:yes stop_codon:yes gene_type:complete